MIKILLIILIVYISLPSISSQNCTSLTPNPDLQCIPTESLKTTICGYDTKACNYYGYMYCDATYTNPTCIPYNNVGEKCTLVEYKGSVILDSCLSPYKCNNETRVCREIGYATFGLKCTFTSDCSSDLLCANNGTCQAKPNSCNGTCGFGSFCKGESCSPLAGVNEACNSDDECIPYSRCTSVTTGSTKVCHPAYYQGKGGECSIVNFNSTVGKDYIQDCEIGLTCNLTSRVCEDYPTPTPSSYNCLAVNASCQSFETCFCTGQSNIGQCYPNQFTKETGVPCLQAAQTYHQCIIKNKCTFDQFGVDPLTPSSCAIKNCGHQYCDMDSKCSEKVQYPSNYNTTNCIQGWYGVCSILGDRPLPPGVVLNNSSYLSPSLLSIVFYIILQSLYYLINQ